MQTVQKFKVEQKNKNKGHNKMKLTPKKKNAIAMRFAIDWGKQNQSNSKFLTRLENELIEAMKSYLDTSYGLIEDPENPSNVMAYEMAERTLLETRFRVFRACIYFLLTFPELGINKRFNNLLKNANIDDENEFTEKYIFDVIHNKLSAMKKDEMIKKLMRRHKHQKNQVQYAYTCFIYTRLSSIMGKCIEGILGNFNKTEKMAREAREQGYLCCVSFITFNRWVRDGKADGKPFSISDLRRVVLFAKNFDKHEKAAANRNTVSYMDNDVPVTEED